MKRPTHWNLALVLGCLTMISLNCIESDKEVVLTFNRAFNDREFDLVKGVLSEELEVIDFGGKVVSTNREDYFRMGVLWAAEFGTKWSIKDIKSANNRILTHEADSSCLNDFLYGGPLEFLYEYTLKGGQIVRLKYDSLPGFYKLQERAIRKNEELSVWIEKWHPENLEKVSEETIEGAQVLKKMLTEYLVEISKANAN